MEASLSGTHRKTYQHLFSHPMPQNLDWRDLLSLLKAIPDMTVDEEHDSHIKASRGGQSLVLHRPQGQGLFG